MNLDVPDDQAGWKTDGKVKLVCSRRQGQSHLAGRLGERRDLGGTATVGDTDPGWPTGDIVIADPYSIMWPREDNFPSPNQQPLRAFSGIPSRVSGLAGQFNASAVQWRCQLAAAVPYFR